MEKCIEYTVKVYEDHTEWLHNGLHHRVDGPAFEYKDGRKFWFLYNKRHRDDGPACVYPNGEKKWYKEGELHRLDGPACEFSSGNRYWLQNGKYHRLDGPAVELVSGVKEWYINGIRLTEEEFNARIKPTCHVEHVILNGKKYRLLLDE
jgi:hypothetical protein